MENLNSQYNDTKQRAKYIIDDSIKRLETYKNERNALPDDSDGIYIIIKGEAKIVNPFDEQKQKIAKLSKYDYFGASKFLSEQSYSYFGNVIASGP